VHARGQVASFRSERGLAPRALRAAINGRLAPEVVCLRADEVQASFDARFAASAREYRYRIDTAEAPDPFTARFVWHRPGLLDVARMRSAARELVGEHDFTSFCRHPGPGRATVRDLQRLTVTSTGERVELGFRANAFLHQMVRALTGTLVLVGDGKLGPDDVARLLANRGRVGTGNLAPANGLTLERVVYGRRTHP
jgi:tRNA pseudouridine38-40 synthase